MGPRPAIENLQRTFVPPAELGTSRPRDVRLTAGGRAVAVAGVVLLLAAVGVGIAMYRVASRQAGDRRALAADGVDATGDVVRLWRASDDNRQPWVAYRFTVEGRAYEGRAKIRLSRWTGLEVGSALPVRYVRTDPALNEAGGAPPGVLPLWLPFVVAAAIAVLGVACGLLLRKQRALLLEGRAAPAIVTGHKKVHTSHGGTHRSMTYTFPLLSGASATGKSGTSSKPPGIGTVICVLYDPEQPGRSLPYPLPLVRIARS